MSTKRVRIDPDDPQSLPEGKIDHAVLDGATEADLASQQRQDDAEAAFPLRLSDLPRRGGQQDVEAHTVVCALAGSTCRVALSLIPRGRIAISS